MKHESLSGCVQHRLFCRSSGSRAATGDAVSFHRCSASEQPLEWHRASDALAPGPERRPNGARHEPETTHEHVQQSHQDLPMGPARPSRWRPARSPARPAARSIVNVEDTVVLATVVAAKNAKPGQDFFPLTVDYIEKTYAAGKIPGSFFKREGRPSELETLTSRLIDRPLRPLFPEGFYNEVQVVIHVLSLNPEVAGRHPGADRRERGAGDLRHPVQRPDRRGARRLHRRPVRAEPDQDAARRVADGPGRRRHAKPRC